MMARLFLSKMKAKDWLKNTENNLKNGGINFLISQKVKLNMKFSFPEEVYWNN